MYNLHRSFLLDPKVTFLNHGSFGATPAQVYQSYQRWQRKLEMQPVEFLGRRAAGLMAEARRSLGEYLGTHADNLVYTTNVTVALNIVARSLELGPGDEVLASDHEYGALDRTWRFLSKERGFRYINQPIALEPEDAVSSGKAPPGDRLERFTAELWSGVTARTRVIFLSHITSPTAQLFPVHEVIHKARQQGILTVIDGAHAAGQIPLQLDALGADFYGGNLHKWLGAPKGAGFLYTRREMQPLLKLLVVSWGYEAEQPSKSRFVDEHEWWGTRDLAAFLAVPDAIRFQAEHDWEKVRSACRDSLSDATGRIYQLTGMDRLAEIDPGKLQMGIVPLPQAVDLTALKSRLYEEFRIEVPMILWKGMKYMRISIQGYNRPRDVDRLLEALKHLI